jgi:hypothetical protein
MTPTAAEPLAAGAVPAMWEPMSWCLPSMRNFIRPTGSASVTARSLWLWFRRRGGSLPLVYNCAV